MQQLNFSRIVVSLSFFCGLFFAQTAFSQATLSIQGTLQKSFGAAVDDGEYALKFRIYTTESGGTPIWSETQDNVDIVNGVYGVLLGTVTPLTVAFDQTYYIGVAVGAGAELSPRMRLTSSPYALSLIGQDNKFPSTGAVGVGTATPTAGNELHVKDAAADAKMTIEGATTSKLVVQSTSGSSIEMKHGANTATISYNGSKISIQNLDLVLTEDINLPAGKTVKYNGLSDWRLIDVDDFEASIEGWQSFSDMVNTNPVGSPIQLNFNGIVATGKGLALPNNTSSWGVLKKGIDLTGIPHSMVKVVATVYATGCWEPDASDYLFAGFQPTVSSPNSQFQTLWSSDGLRYTLGVCGGGYHNGPFNVVGDRVAKYGTTIQMITSHTGNSIALVFPGQFNEPTTDESFIIDNVEIWVK